jgi:thiol-disulfide isomerase/thioredoxin
VTIVVGTTVDSIVKDPTKDVLLEVYAPWCTACQAFAKTYTKLAAAMAASAPSVVIAKMDGTKNEHAELDIEEYPTLVFYAAENGAKPVKIEIGDLKDLAATIQSKAKVPFEVPDLNFFETTHFDNEFDEDDEYLDGEEGELESPTAAPAGAGAAAAKGDGKVHDAPAAAEINVPSHEEL